MRKDGTGHSGPGGYDDDQMPIASTVFAIVAIVTGGLFWWWISA